MGVKQRRPSVAVQVRHLVWNMRCRAQRLTTAAERIALIRDVVVFCVAFWTGKSGFKVKVAVASRLLHVAGGERLIVNPTFDKTIYKFRLKQSW